MRYVITTYRITYESKSVFSETVNHIQSPILSTIKSQAENQELLICSEWVIS